MHAFLPPYLNSYHFALSLFLFPLFMLRYMRTRWNSSFIFYALQCVNITLSMRLINTEGLLLLSNENFLIQYSDYLYFEVIVAFFKAGNFYGNFRIQVLLMKFHRNFHAVISALHRIKYSFGETKIFS